MRTCPSCAREIEGDFGFCPHCGASLTAARPGEQRKTVTVVFCDVTDSTSLGESIDPEALRGLLARYFDRMRTIVQRHGGTVEKFIGDAVMAVFGAPTVHEDDALRAVRAAAEMRDAMPELNIRARLGVNTGEVVTGTEERLVTGDAVNVAARLEQAAPPGDVLIGEPTLALVRNAADVEPIEPLELKGKHRPVPAYRLLRVREPKERRPEMPFVGRERERASLEEAWNRVVAERRCGLVTIVGDGGVGKSRLVAEVLAYLDARVARGRCLPFGEGITYWPVVEVLKQLAMLPEDQGAAASIRSLLEESEAETSAEQIAWAVRKTLERAAGERPLVVVFDDIQWGEETFLDLVEHVVLLSSGVPILVLCMARPELIDRRPAWPAPLGLEPLGEREVRELIPEQIPSQLRDKIARAAGGNPLFVEEMVAMAGEADGEVTVPPTLHALLAARLDELEPAERAVLQLGAVEGEIFHRGAVQALAPTETRLSSRLVALARRGMIGPHEPQLPGEDAFRFRHLLLRDAAYEALPKATRSGLHRRFASWLMERGADLVEPDEIIGYHLEQAHRYRLELGLPADDELAAAARRRLTIGGHRASSRQDFGAAVSLFERAAALAPPSEFDLALETEFCDVLFWAGSGDVALSRADALAQRARAAGDRVAELCGRIEARRLRMELEPAWERAELSALIEQALPVFQTVGDDVALYIAYSALGDLAFDRARMDASLEAHERAAAHARRAGHPSPRSFGSIAAGRFFGTTPVSELMAWLDENEPMMGRDHFFRAYRAGALAMLGRCDEARAILSEARTELSERGKDVLLANITAFESVWVELWAGDPAAAAEFAAEGVRLHEEFGDQDFLSNAAGNLARALFELGRLDESEAWTGRAEELGSSEDAWKEMLWRQVRAKVLAHRGEHVRAELLAREAVAISDGTEILDAQGVAYADLGETLILVGKRDEAAAALEEAVARYERKGNVVMAARTRDRLATLREDTPR